MAIRDSISDAVAQTDRVYKSEAAGDDHIFFDVLEFLCADGPFEHRLDVSHDFRQIDRIVKLVRRSETHAARLAYEELLASRKRRGPEYADLAAKMEVFLLPALAMLDFKTGKLESAIVQTERGIEMHRQYFRSGLTLAGLTILDQNLNILRIRSASPDTQKFKGFALGYFEKVIVGGECLEGTNMLRYRGYGEAADQVARFFLDHLILKTIDRLDGPEITIFFRALVDCVDRVCIGDDQQEGLQIAVKLIDALLRDKAESFTFSRADELSLMSAPGSMMILIEQLTRENTNMDDAFRRAVKPHKGYMLVEKASAKIFSEMRTPVTSHH
jgi:hypothetical protein